jgi:polysaccharide export outer membrane protein
MKKETRNSLKRGVGRGVIVMLSLMAATLTVAFAARSRSQQNPPPGKPQTATPTGRGDTLSGGSHRGANVLVSGGEDYRIGTNDVLDVQVENAPELSGEVRVNAAGAFPMYFLGPVAALNKTPEEVAQFITDQLRGEYLRSPKVTVKVKEYNSRSFFIQGSVRSPNVYQIEGKPSLLELITLAGGLAENHGSTAFVIRKLKSSTAPPPPQPINTSVSRATDNATTDAGPDATGENGPRYELKSVNINQLLKGHFEQDMFLEPGDIINIPPADVFFVAGEVNTPGSYPLKDGTTLRQAISLAQGTKFNAALDRGIIFREGTSGKREEVKVDIGAVMTGKKEDLAILANDIIIVPNSRTKTIGGALLRAFGLSSVGRVPLP